MLLVCEYDWQWHRRVHVSVLNTPSVAVCGIAIFVSTLELQGHRHGASMFSFFLICFTYFTKYLMVQIKDLPLPVTRIWLPSLNATNLSETFSSSQRRPSFAFEMCLTGQGMSRVFLWEDGKYHLSAFYIVTCPVYIWLHFSLHSSFLCVTIPFLISLHDCNAKKKKVVSQWTVPDALFSV